MLTLWRRVFSLPYQSKCSSFACKPSGHQHQILQTLLSSRKSAIESIQSRNLPALLRPIKSIVAVDALPYSPVERDQLEKLIDWSLSSCVFLRYSADVENSFLCEQS